MKKITLVVVLVLFGISLMAQNSADLKLNLEKNKIYKFKSISEQSISQTINGMQQNTSVKSNSVTSIKMVDSKPEFMVAEIRFDTIITHTNAMGRNIDVNSASEGNVKSTDMAEVLTSIMNRLSKNALYVKMDYSGKVIEIVNSKMLSDILMKDTDSITGQMAPMIKMQIKNMAEDKALKTMVEMLTNYLPGKTVSVNDQWTTTVNMTTSGMSMDVTTNYVLDGITGNLASISAESNVKASENATPMEMMGAKITYGEITGISKSQMSVDTKTGLVKENSTKNKVTGNLNVSAPGYNGEIPMEISGETKVIAL